MQQPTISLTCIACELMEHIITIVTYTLCCTSRGTTSSVKSSTASDVVDPVRHSYWGVWMKQLKYGNQEDTITLDFSEAFDKVSHTLLVHKIRCHGIGGRLNTWIESFLDGRQQAVVVEGERSDFVPVESGVLQGSVLRPSLFLTYINDLPAGIKSKVRLFTDDTMCSKTIKKAEDQRTLQEDLDSLITWEEQWSMDFHLQKCSTLSATRKQKKIIPFLRTSA